MRGEDGPRAKAAQDAPSGNLVDDILNGAVANDHNGESDDLLGGDLDDLDDLDHLS